MTVPDWIRFPSYPDDWYSWGVRANAWMNEMRDCVTDLGTRLTAAEADGIYAGYTPTLYNMAGTLTFADFARTGNQVHVVSRIVLTAVPTGVMGMSLPVATTRTGLATAGQVVGTIAGVRFSAELEVFAGAPSTVSFLRASDAGVVNQYWAAGVPGAWGVGSVLFVSFVYQVV